MPHSSGGGHSGHHSSHSHSRSHHSSSHRSGSHSSSRRRTCARTPFRGSRHYRYERFGKTQDVYADYDMVKNKSPLRLLFLIMYIPFYFALFSIIGGSIIEVAKPLEVDYASTDVTVEDYGDMISDYEEEAFIKQAEEFQKRTGITPTIVTISDKVDDGTYLYVVGTNREYTSLTDIAYDAYVNRYYDEKHWLFLCNREDGGWCWEGMQGDDTDAILTSKVTSQFNDIVNEALSEGESMGYAFTEGFSELNKTKLMGIHIDFLSALPILIMLAFITGHMYLCVFAGSDFFKRNLHEVKDDNSTDNNAINKETL